MVSKDVIRTKIVPNYAKLRFKEYSNEYEFTAEGVFRRIVPPACPQCGKAMSHNGSSQTAHPAASCGVFIKNQVRLEVTFFRILAE